MSNPVLRVADDNVYNADEVPNSLTGEMKRNIVSLKDVGTANEIRRSPFGVNDFKRCKTDLITVRYQPAGDGRPLAIRRSG